MGTTPTSYKAKNGQNQSICTRKNKQKTSEKASTFGSHAVRVTLDRNFLQNTLHVCFQGVSFRVVGSLRESRRPNVGGKYRPTSKQLDDLCSNKLVQCAKPVLQPGRYSVNLRWLYYLPDVTNTAHGPCQFPTPKRSTSVPPPRHTRIPGESVL